MQFDDHIAIQFIFKMKTIVIGGTGHIGTYLIPILVDAGYNVVNITRGKSKPYVENPAFQKIENIIMDRDTDSKFAEKISKLNPDIVIDLINFRIQDTQDIVRELQKTKIQHYLYCSSIWAHGRACTLPLDPNDPHKTPLDEYGINKFQSELYLKDQFQKNGFPCTIIMPGQICGPGWTIINPWGNTTLSVIQKIANGEQIFLPNLGMETLHHIHAEDVARMFFLAVTHREKSLGQAFHAVAESSITLYGYARLLFEFFGKEERIGFLPWDKWREHVGDEEQCRLAYLHLARSGTFSIENAKERLEFSPKHTNVETIRIAVQSYVDRGLITVGKE